MNPNNTETDYDYTHYWDVGGGVEIVTNKRTSDSTTLSQFTYTFDANRNKISELDQMTDAGEGASNTQLYTWAYDADGRLTDETFDNQNDGTGGADAVTTDDYHNHYDYDLDGNRLDEKVDSKADGGTGSTTVYDQVTNYVYNGNNELTSETQTTVANGTTVYSTNYLYDGNGSLLTATRTGSGASITNYTYDARNRILTVASGGSTTTYTYDDDGLLVQQVTTSGDTSSYLIDTYNPTGYSQVLEVHKNGSLTTTYTLGQAIIAQNAGGTISYIMPDGHGSTRQLTSFTSSTGTSGHVTARYDYDAFGNPITLTATTHAADTADTSVLYVGMLLDPITGNYRTQTREYTATDGRFFTQDTYLPRAGNEGNANLYIYVGGNPITRFDRNGQDWSLPNLTVSIGIQAGLAGLSVPVAAGITSKLSGGGFWSGALHGTGAGVAIFFISAKDGGLNTKFAADLSNIFFQTALGMLVESFGAWAKDPNNFEYTPKLINDLFWSNFSTYAEGKAFNLGLDDPVQAAVATAGTKLLASSPDILWSAAKNIYHVIEGQPTNWSDTGWALANATMDALVAGFKVYVNEGHPEISDLPEPFKTIGKQLIWGGWSILFSELKHQR